MLNVEIEADGDSCSTYERGPSLVGLLGSSHAGTIDFCPALTDLVSRVQNIIFLTAYFFTLLAPIDHQPGQVVV